MAKLHAAWAILINLAASACMPPPAQDVSDAARELNIAARFGRMDVAAEHSAEKGREAFLQRRAEWGRELRVVDIELSMLNMKASDEAEVFVDVSWMRLGEGLLRATRIKQSWTNPGGGWKLAEESRASGDFGLFGEPVVVLRPEPTVEARFPTKTIR